MYKRTVQQFGSVMTKNTGITHSVRKRELLMSDQSSQFPKRNPSADQQQSNLQKEPQHWVTGDEPMTGAQASYLKTLCEETNEEFDAELTKQQASERIEALQQKSGRTGG